MLNQVQLIGHVGKDPEVRELGGGGKVAHLSVATTHRFTDGAGNRQEETEWTNLSAFGGVVSVIERFVKSGSRIYVSGRLRTREYEAKEGGKRYATEVIIVELLLLDRAPKAETPGQ